MSEVLVIRLGSHYEDTISWMIWSEVEKQVIASRELNGAAELSKLTEEAQSRVVKILVPACDVTMKTVALPGKASRQVLAALPYMLEDDLAEDVDDLFFAHGQKTQLDGKPAMDVAIVSQKVMAQWMSWLDDADIYTTIIVPDALCLPVCDAGVAAIELADQWLLRGAHWQCDSIDKSWFEQYINLRGAQFIADNNEQSDEQSEQAEQARLNLICFSPCEINAPDVVITDEERELALQLLAANIDGAGFNLLQGQYVKKKESSQIWKTWRVAATIAITAIVLQLVYRGAVVWQLDSELTGLKDTYVSQYKQAYPKQRVRPNLIERQLKSRLKEGSGGSSGESFLVMLDKVAPLFAQSGEFIPEIIKFDDKRGELRVNAVADGYETYEKFKTAVEGLGYEVHQGSLSNNSENKITGVVTIKGAS